MNSSSPPDVPKADRREGLYHQLVRAAGGAYEGFDLGSCEIVLDLAYTYDVLHHIAGRYMAEYGLSKSSFNILMLLRHGPEEGMQLHGLGELLLVSRANITGLIDHLEEKGWAKRVVDDSDRRVRFARITKKGEALLDEAVPGHFRNVRALLGDLTASDKETLARLLKKTRASLMAHSEDRLRASHPELQTVSE